MRLKYNNELTKENIDNTTNKTSMRLHYHDDRTNFMGLESSEEKNHVHTHIHAHTHTANHMFLKYKKVGLKIQKYLEIHMRY
jgi:hypothetical protein